MWLAAFVLMVFASGTATGLLLHRVLEPRAWADAPGGRPRVPGRRPPPSPADLATKMSDDLGLTADQRARLQTILEARRGKLDAIEQEIRTRFDQEHRDLNAEIERILTPEQREKFKTFQERMRSRGRGRGRPPGPPPGGLPPI
jgi:Spy/CpxP family protein refolding chaperone